MKIYLMRQCQFATGNVLIPGQSQTYYISLGMSIEALRHESCNAGSKRAWIDTSYCGTVIGIKKTIKVTSLNTVIVG